MSQPGWNLIIWPLIVLPQVPRTSAYFPRNSLVVLWICHQLFLFLKTLFWFYPSLCLPNCNASFRPFIMLFVLWVLVLIQFSSIQFSHSVMSSSLQPHGLQHARPPCPSSTPRVYSNSHLLSRWCHPTISSPVVPFSCRHLFQLQGLLKWVSSSHQVAKVLEFQL